MLNPLAVDYQAVLGLVQLACEITNADPRQKIFVYGNNLPDGNYTKIEMRPQNGYLDAAGSQGLAAALKKII